MKIKCLKHGEKCLSCGYDLDTEITRLTAALSAANKRADEAVAEAANFKQLWLESSKEATQLRWLVSRITGYANAKLRALDGEGR